MQVVCSMGDKDKELPPKLDDLRQIYCPEQKGFEVLPPSQINSISFYNIWLK